MSGYRRTPLSTKRRWLVLERDEFTCRYCGATGDGVRLEVDHVHPVSKGGTNRMDNLVTSCRTCNQGKRARWLRNEPPAWTHPTQQRSVQGVRVRFDRRRSAAEHRHVADTLCLYWEPNYSAISDGYIPEEMSALRLLERWVAEVGGGDVTIAWFVVGAVIKIERAPGDQPPGSGCFTDYYTHPRTANGAFVSWRAVPVQDLSWSGSRGAWGKSGFIQEATGWKPYPYQKKVNAGELLALAREVEFV